MANNIPITAGSGTASVATETVGGIAYQQIELLGKGGSSTLAVNPDGSLKASIIGTPTVFIAGSVAIVGTTANQSVSGIVGASIIGQLPAGTAVLGSIMALQGSNPWIITGSVQAAITPSANQSVSGAVQVDVRGSVAVAIISGSIAATFTPPANQSVSGTVGASVIGNVNTTITSIATVGQVMGSVAALQATNPWIVTSSVAGGIFPVSGSVAAVIIGTPNVNAAGSVVAFQGAGWSGSVAAIVTNTVNVAGSVAAFITGTASVIVVFQAPSIVGTYAEDAASATGDKGFLVMGARNDTLASVTSADGDYSSHVVGPAGELIAVNAPFTKWVSGTASALGGVPMTTSVTVVGAQGASIFTYITAIQVANNSANNVLVSFYGGTESILGRTMAPANGGSNITIPNGWKTNANSAFASSVSGVASIYVSAQGFIAKI